MLNVYILCYYCASNIEKFTEPLLLLFCLQPFIPVDVEKLKSADLFVGIFFLGSNASSGRTHGCNKGNTGLCAPWPVLFDLFRMDTAVNKTTNAYEEVPVVVAIDMCISLPCLVRGACLEINH